MAETFADLSALLSEMEAALNSITQFNVEVLEFVDEHFSTLLNDQKVVQVFKNVGDAEDELQRQLNFLRSRLTAGIAEFKSVCEAEG